MRTREFLSKLDHDRIVQAIRDAESKTSGEIRVYVRRGKMTSDPLDAARKQFRKLGMERTPDRNAVLIFVAPRAHKFAVVGDEAIHEKCGESLWQGVADGMRADFQRENFTDALIHGINELGNALATHFPPRSTSPGKLADEVIEG